MIHGNANEFVARHIFVVTLRSLFNGLYDSGLRLVDEPVGFKTRAISPNVAALSGACPTVRCAVRAPTSC